MNRHLHIAVLYIILFGLAYNAIDRDVFRIRITLDQCTIYNPVNGKLPSDWDNYGKYKGG